MFGNYFSGHIFDMNEDHLAGKLRPMRWQPNSLDGVPYTMLVIKPIQKPKRAKKPKKPQKKQENANEEL